MNRAYGARLDGLCLIGDDDCVARRARFEADQPDVTIVPPGTQHDVWRAIVPAGRIPADDAATTISALSLCSLMDKLDVACPPTG